MGGLGRILGKLLAVLILLLVLGVAGILLWLRLTLPSHEGNLTIAGLAAPVEIVWDEHGIPTIHAGSMEDGYQALGYLHARDRMFQMDSQRRYGEGRLAEVLGPRALHIDQQMRMFGFGNQAEGELAHQSPEFRRVLDAYAAGINDWIAEKHRLPIEFYLLGYRPEPWRPADTLVYGKLLALELSGNYRRELQRAHLAAKLSPDEMKLIMPDYPKDGPVALGDLAALYRALPVAGMLGALPPQTGPTAASNNWVVDGKHSVTGKPILANDPHLGYTMPSIWYLARLECPDFSLAGATMPGAPLFILGHNRRVAWGYTTTNADVEDLFIEKTDPQDPSRYLVPILVAPGGSLPFEARQAVIHVKGAANVVMNIRTTRHGVVLSDFAEDAKPGPSDEVMALSASFLTDDDISVEAQWRLNMATNWAQFTTALKDFSAPAQNIVYADVDGNIGFYVPGRIPTRKAGDGTMPEPGWTGDYDWTGWIPFDKLPHVYNPASGHVVTANNKIVPDSYPYLITKDWELPNRALRIEALLKEQPRQSIDTSAAIQRDVVSLSARRITPLLLGVPPQNDQQRRAHDLLAGWDGTMAKDSPQPLLYASWYQDLLNRLAAAKLGPDSADAPSFDPLFVEAVLTRAPQWCDGATAGKGCATLVTAALDQALKDLTDRYGEDMNKWRWGGAHQATFAHPLFGHIRILKDIFNRVVPDGGAIDTVHAAGYFSDNDVEFTDIHGPGLRAVYDLANLDQSVFMIGPGQSEDVTSANYGDLLKPWQRGDWLTLPARAKGTVLRLEPKE